MQCAISELVGTTQAADARCFKQKRRIPAQRLCKTVAHCSKSDHAMPEDACRETVNAMRAVVVLVAMSVTLCPGEAYAWGHSWRPRRHHRRMAEPRAAIDVKQFFQVQA